MADRQWRFVFPGLIGLALCAMPFQYFPWIRGADVYDNQRLLTTACALLAAAVVSLRLCMQPVVRVDLGPRPRVFLGLFLLAGLVASFGSFSVGHALFETATFALLFLLAWLVADGIRSDGDTALDEILLWCGFACAIYLIVHFGVYAHALQTAVQPKSSHLFFGYNNFRFFNHVQTISLPLLALLALRLESPFRRHFWTVITILWWALLYVSAGRGSMLGLLFGVLFAGFLLRRSAMAWLKFMFMSAVAGFGVFLLLYVCIPLLRQMQPFGSFFTLASRTSENPTSSRLALWERSMELILGSPWLGVGPGHFAHHASDLNIAAHPHNWVLQIGSEWGIPALFVLSSLVLLSLAAIAKARPASSASDQLTQSALLTAALAIAIDGLVSGLIVFPGSQLWMTVFFGIAWGWCSTKHPPRASFHAQPPAWARAAVVAAIGLLGVAVVHFIVSQLDAVARQAEMDKSGFYFIPRLFLSGFF